MKNVDSQPPSRAESEVKIHGTLADPPCKGLKYLILSWGSFPKLLFPKWGKFI